MEYSVTYSSTSSPLTGGALAWPGLFELKEVKSKSIGCSVDRISWKNRRHHRRSTSCLSLHVCCLMKIYFRSISFSLLKWMASLTLLWCIWCCCHCCSAYDVVVVVVVHTMLLSLLAVRITTEGNPRAFNLIFIAGYNDIWWRLFAMNNINIRQMREKLLWKSRKLFEWHYTVSPKIHEIICANLHSGLWNQWSVGCRGSKLHTKWFSWQIKSHILEYSSKQYHTTTASSLLDLYPDGMQSEAYTQPSL